MSKTIVAAVTGVLIVAACSTTKPPEPAMNALASAQSAPSAAPAAAPPGPPAQIGKWGIDLTSRDSNVKPGDDFYRYSIGHWLDTNEIPPDRTSWSTFAVLANEAE